MLTVIGYCNDASSIINDALYNILIVWDHFIEVILFNTIKTDIISFSLQSYEIYLNQLEEIKKKLEHDKGKVALQIMYVETFHWAKRKRVNCPLNIIQVRTFLQETQI